MDKTEKRICWYSSILIALLMSSPRLLALRQNGLMAQFWHFNLYEFLFQVGTNAAFCYLIFFVNLYKGARAAIYAGIGKQIVNILVNVFLTIICCLAAGIIQRHAFPNFQIKGVFWSGYFGRYFLSALFAGIIIKIIMLMRESKQTQLENNQLKTAYLEAELEVLKEQLNPHFLFNSLSSLSGVIREDPEKAQHFIQHLSKIFRYSLSRSQNHLVTIDDELKMIKSYEELLKMRFEKAFQLEMTIDDQFMEVMVPHLSLQPLLENAAKHNTASVARPLIVKIFISGNNLVVSNNLQEIMTPENTTGIGLANLNRRFRILMHKEIEIEKNDENFVVKLPVIA